MQNVMGCYPNFIGSTPLGFNQYLEENVTYSSSLASGVWVGDSLILQSPRIAQGIYDHIHYDVSTELKTAEELFNSKVWNTEYLVLTLPQISGIYVSMIAHDIFHRTYFGSAVTYSGPYLVDTVAPTGKAFLNGNTYFTREKAVKLEVSATDNISGVGYIYIDGDIEDGANIRNWITYSGAEVDVTLTGVYGKKTVNVRIKDNAGNVSDTVSDSIIYTIARYLFQRVAQKRNRLKSGEGYGKLGSN